MIKSPSSTVIPSDQLGRTSISCWLCQSFDLRAFKASNINSQLSTVNFRITDNNYGHTAALDQCGSCGFIQASMFNSVIEYYSGMDDVIYEDTREQRKLQARKLLLRLKKLTKTIPKPTLFDIGAGSGVLLEEAKSLGIEAEGIEPSRWLVKEGQKHGIKINVGSLPSSEITGQYDIVTLVDVLEHVPNPVELLRQAKTILKPNGLLFVVTPDVKSIVARLLGEKWWHYRIAHIGYFDSNTIRYSIKKAGLSPMEFYRPSWYFPASYLIKRIGKYFSPIEKLPLPSRLANVTVPLNLFDSWAVICKNNLEHN